MPWFCPSRSEGSQSLLTSAATVQTGFASRQRRGWSERSVHAAIVGTFDVSNFGDLLFPLLAEHELRKRLPSLQLTRYSYRQMGERSWPYSVRSLCRLPEDMPGLDLVLVGGGHLVRFEKHVAPGYGPTEAGLHHPTGYWLMPTLLGIACGVPVAWSAVGVSANTPSWSRALLALALRQTAYVSVRDEPSARELQEVAGNAPIHIVPDTAFGIRSLLPAQPSDRFRSFCSKAGLASPYLIVQPSRQLLRFSEHLKSAVGEARAQGCAVLELPISPILGDCPGILSIDPPPIQCERWPDPLLLSEIIGNAEAVIAQSLHLSIVALAMGVPVHRPRSGEGCKYQVLERFQGVHLWNEASRAAADMKRGLARRAPGTDVVEALALLATHWDRVTQLLQQRPKPCPGVMATVLNVCTSMAERAFLREQAALQPQTRNAAGDQLNPQIS